MIKKIDQSYILKIQRYNRKKGVIYSIFTLLIFLSFEVLSGPHPIKDKGICTQHFKEIVAKGVRDDHGKSLPVKSVDGNTIIVDTNLLVALGQVNSRTADYNHMSTVQHLNDYLKKVKDKIGNPILSATKTTTYETAYRDEKIPSGVSVVKVAQYKQQDYDNIMDQLKKAHVGGANQESLNAQNDRKIIIDVLLSERASNAVVPKFATRDSGIVIPLCLMNPQCFTIFKNASTSSAVNMITSSNYHLIRDKFPNGFSVAVKDKSGVTHSMQILPL